MRTSKIDRSGDGGPNRPGVRTGPGQIWLRIIEISLLVASAATSVVLLIDASTTRPGHPTQATAIDDGKIAAARPGPNAMSTATAAPSTFATILSPTPKTVSAPTATTAKGKAPTARTTATSTPNRGATASASPLIPPDVLMGPGPEQLPKTIAASSGLCIDVPNAQNTDGIELQLWGCTNTYGQQWTVNDDDGTIQAMGKCLDVVDRVATLKRCAGTPTQRWAYRSGEIIQVSSGQCLDSSFTNPVPASKILLNRCTGWDGQLWKIPAYWMDNH